MSFNTMKLPLAAIIGRPNVGKSSLFNYLAGRRLAIVERTPGVTLDRIGTIIEHDECRFELVDTGGLGMEKKNLLAKLMAKQIEKAVDEADVLVMVVDAQDGLTARDRRVAEILRKKRPQPVLVANKVDNDRLEMLAAEFFSLGFGPPVLTSTTTGLGKEALLQAITKAIPTRMRKADAPPEGIKLAIVGKRNVGKSTLVNALVRQERMIVSDIPGTTRDSVDVRFERDGKAFVAIDTAGVRRRGQLHNNIEFFGSHRALRSIRRCDVAIFLMDAAAHISAVDKKLTNYIIQESKPCVLVVNKWDIAGEIHTSAFQEYLEERLPALYFAPVIYASALERMNLWPIVETAESLYKQANSQITTGVLNRVVKNAMRIRSPKPVKGREGKIFYATQTRTAPPTMTLFVNDKLLFKQSYLRYIVNSIRAASPFTEITLRLVLRTRRSEPKTPQRTPGQRSRS